MSTECWLLLLLLLLMHAGFVYPPGTAQSNGARLAILAGGGTRATQIPAIILRASGASKLYCTRFNRKPPQPQTVLHPLQPEASSSSLFPTPHTNTRNIVGSLPHSRRLQSIARKAQVR